MFNDATLYIPQPPAPHPHPNSNVNQAENRRTSIKRITSQFLCPPVINQQATHITQPVLSKKSAIITEKW